MREFYKEYSKHGYYIPKNESYEQGVLAILICKPHFRQTYCTVEPEMFYWWENQEIYKALQQLKDAPGGWGALLEYFNAHEDLLATYGEVYGKEKEALFSYIKDLADAGHNLTDDEDEGEAPLERAFEHLKEYHIRRAYQDASDNMDRYASDMDKSLDDVISDIEKEHKKIIHLYNTDTEVDDLQEVGREVYLQLKANEGKKIVGIPTGYKRIDEALRGFAPTNFVVIAGRPSMGKTAFMLNLIARISVSHKSLFFTMETSKHQICSLLATRMQETANIDEIFTITNLRGDTLTSKQWDNVGRTMARLSELNLTIDDETRSLTSLVQKVRRMRARGQVEAVFIDYLQLIQAGHSKTTDYSKGTEISNTLKGLAMECGIPIITLCQLNRACEQREDHRPRMSDLRESGHIEQDADIIAFCYREDYYHRDDPNWIDNNQFEFIISKQKMGPCETIHLNFQPDTGKIKEI